MENLNDIQLPKINRLVDWKTVFDSAKAIFFNLLTVTKKLFLFGLSAVSLLILQILIIGVFDRVGVSPKVSLIVSSLIYATIFAGAAIVGGLKSKVVREVITTHLNPTPICKVLIIKKKKQEI